MLLCYVLKQKGIGSKKTDRKNKKRGKIDTKKNNHRQVWFLNDINPNTFRIIEEIKLNFYFLCVLDEISF